MRTIQDWINENIKKDRKQIFISDTDIKEKLEGTQLIIKDYPNLRNIYIKLEQIKSITIENSEQLEDIEATTNEIKLIGNYSQLKSIKINQREQNPVIIEKKEPWLCWKCISIFAFFTILFTIMILYFNKKISKFIEYHKKICGEGKKRNKK